MSSEELISSHCKEFGLNAVTLRVSNVYGPWSQSGLLIHDLVTMLYSNKSTHLFTKDKLDSHIETSLLTCRILGNIYISYTLMT